MEGGELNSRTDKTPSSFLLCCVSLSTVPCCQDDGRLSHRRTGLRLRPIPLFYRSARLGPGVTGSRSHIFSVARLGPTSLTGCLSRSEHNGQFSFCLMYGRKGSARAPRVSWGKDPLQLAIEFQIFALLTLGFTQLLSSSQAAV